MNVLVAEDYEDTRMILQATLQAAGYSVRCASNGREALKMVRHDAPDIIISDILMPEMDGFGLCRTVKADAALHHIPFIFYTATYVDEADRELAMAAGASRFLIKPMESQALLAIVREVLGECKQQPVDEPEMPKKQGDDLELMHERALIRKLDKKVRDLEHERAALKQSEQQLRNALAEKEVLLRELHHRVKNNMQVLCSLMRLQADSVAGKKNVTIQDEFTISYQRIRAMALVHESMCLYDELDSIDFRTYVSELAAALINNYHSNSEVRLTVKGRCRLNMDQAVPCSLIANELITNCLKHAFPPASSGDRAAITIMLSESAADMIDMSISDNGCGMPESVEWRKPATMGLELVNILTSQLHGTLALDRSHGTCFSIRFMGGR